MTDHARPSGIERPAPAESREHPRLHFGPRDIQALRRKGEHPLLKADWAAIRRSADAALNGSPVPPGRPAKALPRAAAAAATCAFVYRLTGDNRLGARARQICHAILATDGWTGDFAGNGTPGGPQFHLGTAAICHGLALAYDMLAPDLTPAQRRHFVTTCYDRALRTFIEECRGSANRYLNGNRTTNWLAVLSSGAGRLFIALDGDGDGEGEGGIDFSNSIEIARAHTLRYLEWHDDDGSAVEHGGYWVYGMGNALHLLDALKHNGWPRILQQAGQKLQRTAYPILHGCVGGKNVANFGDDTYGPLVGARDNALQLAAEFQDPHLQWWAGQLPTAGVRGFIAADPTLAAVPPDDLPTCIVFPRSGVGILRGSMTDPDTPFLALKAGVAHGPLFDGPHCQFDLNSIVLDAFGTTLLADPGYSHDWTGPMSENDPAHPVNSTPPHNTVLIDSRGQEAQFSPLASLDDLSPSADIDYLIARIERGYGPNVARFDRHAWFVDKRFYVLLDDIELTRPGTITWSFHAAKDAHLSATTPATITNGPASLRILPTSQSTLTCTQRDDHVLPRLQWDTAGPVKAARVAWLLMPDRGRSTAAAPTVELHPDSLVVSQGQTQWRLPVVTRRVPHRSSLTLIPDPAP